MGTIGCEKGKKAEILNRLYHVNTFFYSGLWSTYGMPDQFKKFVKMTLKEYQTWLFTMLASHDSNGEEDEIHGLAFDFITILMYPGSCLNRDNVLNGKETGLMVNLVKTSNCNYKSSNSQIQ